MEGTRQSQQNTLGFLDEDKAAVIRAKRLLPSPGKEVEKQSSWQRRTRTRATRAEARVEAPGGGVITLLRSLFDPPSLPRLYSLLPS